MYDPGNQDKTFNGELDTFNAARPPIWSAGLARRHNTQELRLYQIMLCKCMRACEPRNDGARKPIRLEEGQREVTGTHMHAESLDAIDCCFLAVVHII
jgi:hypothetical protein